ncbi:DUF3883 domain-containing protein [Parahaliea maris]|uniref:DUF3883 domain-containing protein n=1 Tax=Parahaliea maris TaxID=2716870 RepID=A0A5C8ZVW0_9GAMM|nr:DUF3883 domain-containing protein [Parahaliea maris]TXS91904.1 DUF3883 domain-containing protein [Parahaliea maris]
MSLLDYERGFSSLKVNTHGGGEKSPHKVAMLLAVLDLFDANEINENRIDFNEKLKTKFSANFNTLAGPRDRDNPHLPYFHLRSSGFWHHRVKAGCSGVYASLSTASGAAVIQENIDFVYLDDELFELLSYGTCRELLRAALYRNLNSNDLSKLLNVGAGWDWLECEAVVGDYFEMLNLEQSGVSYNKAAHRRKLKAALNGRSDGSIEYKHQNISAILLEMGQPYIPGYKPAFNYQAQLKSVVLTYLAGHQSDIDRILEKATQVSSEPPEIIDWLAVLDAEIPERIVSIQEPHRRYLASRPNFAERERVNRKLGEQGEAFVIEFERRRLIALERADLAAEVMWTSKEEGDGRGYDVRSFDPDLDSELFIEVKTTNNGKYQPFFISANELAFSKERAEQYSLYRVFDFKKKARIFQLPGAVDKHVNLLPNSYRASFSQ